MRVEDLVTFEQARKIYRCSRPRIYQLIQEGKLTPAVDFGRKKLFFRKEVERLATEIVPRRPREGKKNAA